MGGVKRGFMRHPAIAAGRIAESAVSHGKYHFLNIDYDGLDINARARYIGPMMTAAQMRAGRALLGIDQKGLAALSGVSLPTIQRMEASDGNVRGNVDSLVKVVDALGRAGVELIGEDAPSLEGGRGVRLRAAARRDA